MKLTCYVVDDEPLAVELMEGYVRKTPFLELKGSFYSASATFEALGREAVDLLFCDDAGAQRDGAGPDAA